MSLFLIMSMPLWFLLLNSFYRNDRIRKRDFFIPLGKGSLIFIVALLLNWLFTRKLSLGQVSPFRLYFYDLFFYNGLIHIVWIGLFFIVQMIWPPVREKVRTREIMLFLVPLFLGDSIYRSIIQESWYGLYELFLMPLSNMSLLIVLAIVIGKEEKEEFLGKILYLFLSIAVLLFSNLIPLFVSYNLDLVAVLIGISFFVFSLFLFIKEIKR